MPGSRESSRDGPVQKDYRPAIFRYFSTWMGPYHRLPHRSRATLEATSKKKKEVELWGGDITVAASSRSTYYVAASCLYLKD